MVEGYFLHNTTLANVLQTVSSKLVRMARMPLTCYYSIFLALVACFCMYLNPYKKVFFHSYYYLVLYSANLIRTLYSGRYRRYLLSIKTFNLSAVSASQILSSVDKNSPIPDLCSVWKQLSFFIFIKPSCYA